jgi:uncharacterized SAM-binding protein YcdF (DUF218 family)
VLTEEQIQKLSDYIFIKSEPEKADLIFVFGTRSPQPISITLQLYNKKYASRIMISGGENKVIHVVETDDMSNKLINMGVKKKDIIKENKSTNTLENVIFSRAILENTIGLNKIKTMLVVVKSYHARRALMTLRKNLSSTIKYLPIPYEGNINGVVIRKSGWFENPDSLKKVLEEESKIREYLAKGNLEELP